MKNSNLNFNSSDIKCNTKKFREDVLKKTLQVPGGPQSFTETTYLERGFASMSNKDPGDVEKWVQNGLTNTREQVLNSMEVKNAFKPTPEQGKDIYDIQDWVRAYQSYIAERSHFGIYPYFTPGQDHNIIGIMNTDHYDTESQLFKFAALYLKEDTNGPIFARIRRNLYTATAGRLNILDALQGNSSMAINLITGKEPLIEFDNKITVNNSIPGKGINFLETVTGVQVPWSEIPGDYLSNPSNPVNIRPEAASEAGRILQDIAGNAGQLIGIQRRPKIDRKPSDLFIDYMGSGTKRYLFNNLSYNTKYAPNYTTSARSQNSSKIFSFADKFAQGINNVFGMEPIAGIAYVGDDRGNNFKNYLTDNNGNAVYGTYNLSLEFDQVQGKLFENQKGIFEGGEIGGKLTWISSKSKNKRGPNENSVSNPPSFDRFSRNEIGVDQSELDNSLSTKFKFRSSSIFGKTQEILESLPDGGASRTHVANAMDQTSRVFRMGNSTFSKGSNIKYVNKTTGEESGVEYCRAWTKDRPYFNNSNLMKRTGLIRKFEGSVLSTPYNLNIYPNSNGNRGFAGSTNIFSAGGGDFYAKKYMFSIENLAWKSSNVPGYTYNDLPYCERGNNGGRIMWFPPYDLKVTDQSSAKWESNTFLGRPEPIYTYSNTERTGQVTFKVIVDHPSILNLLVKNYFQGMTDAEADNYIHAFFAGCEDLDFYGLIRRYTTITSSESQKITDFIQSGNNKDGSTLVTDGGPAQLPKPEVSGNTETKEYKSTLYFDNDIPKGTQTEYYDSEKYENLLTSYTARQSDYLNDFEDGLNTLDNLFIFNPDDTNAKNDMGLLLSKTTPLIIPADKEKLLSILNNAFTDITTSYNKFKDDLAELKANIVANKAKNITITIASATSAVADTSYNLALSYRRSNVIINDVVEKLATDNKFVLKWDNLPPAPTDTQGIITTPIIISLKDTLGYTNSTDNITIKRVENLGETANKRMSSKANYICSDKNVFYIKELNRTAPITFYCRESEVTISYTLDSVVKTVAPGSPGTEPQINVLPNQQKKTEQTITTPSLNEMKKIIMKTLGECYYFKQMEEQTPMIFSSLKEKLKYFHPAFHSMTPEGLNARLTFLQQCIRPGDTIPIKGISDVNDMTARNTTFGAPPICIMRIGDFYNSKIIIRDVNIDFDEAPWDYNPEGIGIQPMIANVQLTISFIGGHGLEKPVEKLQNALSSNFYANTEIYDYRSISTNQIIDGKNASQFAKEEIDKMLKPLPDKVTPNVDPKSSNVMTNEKYIGDMVITEFYYDNLINSLYDSYQTYFDAHKNILIDVFRNYGPKISAMFFASAFRKTYLYDVENGTGINTIELLGQYQQGDELVTLCRNLKNSLIEAIYSTEYITKTLGLYNVVTPIGAKLTELQLKDMITESITSIIDDFSSGALINDLEKSRNNLISILDKLNFVTSTSRDGKVNGKISTSVDLAGFNRQNFYDTYSTAIDYISTNYSKFINVGILDSSFNYSNPAETVTPEILTEFLSCLLKTDKDLILSVYSKDAKMFPPDKINAISALLDDFFIVPSTLILNFPSYSVRKDTNPVGFPFTIPGSSFSAGEDEILKRIMSDRFPLDNIKLNYFKP